MAHDALGQEVKAIVVLHASVSASEEAQLPAELGRWCGKRLACFKVPAHRELRREALPRTATGKVQKALLAGDAPNPFVEESR